MSRQWAKKLAAATSVLVVVLFTSRIMPAGPQEQPESVPSQQPKEEAKLAPPDENLDEQRVLDAKIDKMLDAYDLKPHPEPPIPDDPPPHEGAMIDRPYIIEPPDLVLVEVLESLPGRPISGERLVRGDGTISLGFYGDVYVRGLTIPQAKVKIIKHLRRILTDDVLGLIDHSDELLGPDSTLRQSLSPRIPDIPEEESPFKRDDEKKPKAEPEKSRTIPSGCRIHSAPPVREKRRFFDRPSTSTRIQRVARRQEEKKADEARKPIEIPLQGGGQITIKIEVEAPKPAAAAAAPDEGMMLGKPLPLDENDRVFVDVTAYNSKNYYVEGDVGSPGRLPFAGLETVLDAIHFAGGLISTAEPKDIRLVRPARGGKPAKVYKVDLKAIQEKGDLTANYQIFPGDRLVVGRNDVVKKTIELDRLALPMQTVLNSMRQESSLLQSLQTASPQNHDAILRDLVEFWIQEMKRPEGAKLDEQTLREALIKRLQIKPK